MTQSTDYHPPIDEAELLLKWIRRARESQASHYDMADRLHRRGRWLGIAVITITSLIGTSAFLSLVATAVSSFLRAVVGLTSIVAAVLAALQTFLRYEERAEQHRAAGARYGAVRRKLEAIHAGDADARDGHYLTSIREELDRLAEDVPNVPTAYFQRSCANLPSVAQ
ncbi:hypothetical protein AWB81_03774 [Caballeronia arationis]|jgi:hypothetical protein|uniref:SMODS and SLOG-associating 2TM effector domain-containing protein n=1 Tax=Caballeronia arationis TaxID=1777142 RepID=A0A7Z7I368_9BURK|nr:SLATT domain-containing protein [Caballeronia arationis]SAK77918.1 hypothetical protein AWB81_03774 [Caballeronia arationis]SOE57916.1 hypothetical protein SAMN05446927_1521 [Caballeronia arationis]